MASFDLILENDNKENVSPSNMATISTKPIDCSSIDKDKTQFRFRIKKYRRQPLQDITNLFVSSPPLSSSFLIRHSSSSSPSLSVDPKSMKRRSGVGLKAAATTSSAFSCRNFR